LDDRRKKSIELERMLTAKPVGVSRGDDRLVYQKGTLTKGEKEKNSMAISKREGERLGKKKRGIDCVVGDVFPGSWSNAPEQERGDTGWSVAGRRGKRTGTVAKCRRGVGNWEGRSTGFEKILPFSLGLRR